MSSVPDPTSLSQAAPIVPTALSHPVEETEVSIDWQHKQFIYRRRTPVFEPKPSLLSKVLGGLKTFMTAGLKALVGQGGAPPG
jgi:hypothetical protein